MPAIVLARTMTMRGRELPEFVEVELTISPETGQVNEPISIEAKITQGERKCGGC